MEILNHTDKNKIFQVLKENITIVALVIYGVTFLNYYIYYNSFQISIFNYIGLNDMIFFFLEYIFKILSCIIITEILLFSVYVFLHNIFANIRLTSTKKRRKYFKNLNENNRKRISNVIENSFSESLILFKLTIITLSIFGLAFLPFKTILIPAYFIYLIYLLEKIQKERDYQILTYFGGALVFISLLITTFINSYDKRFEKDDSNISFYENTTFVTTNKDVSCYNYLGETSTHIFLYDIEKKNSKIYNKNNLSDITIKNSNIIDSSITKIRKTEIYVLFEKMMSE
ncbi:hypothetical protein [Flavobacterium sp. GP15]|uniref:hypothetical protein n=1 Tax=Flavobacterium sp. GP15 TaxID=2758567 RepID=UPI00165D9264|nr:hypothetical protein [Flavobacterium sp. GP15]